MCLNVGDGQPMKVAENIRQLQMISTTTIRLTSTRGLGRHLDMNTPPSKMPTAFITMLVAPGDDAV